jgi:NAD(P)-dependent dehydrogenase (short-subunit alcohol dehydrogenase family)
MGLAAAQLMSEAGWPVLMCDLDADRLAAATVDLPAETETLAGDISDLSYGETLLAKLAGRPIGALIHCAGLSPTLASVERILDVNLAATMRLVETVRPQMSEGAAAVLYASCSGQQMGDVLDAQIEAVTTPEAVASLAAFCNGNSGAAYSISKRAVQALVRREAKAFGKRGLRVASISPGIIDTPMGRSEMAKQPIMQKMIENSALERAARPEEVSAVAVFLCSPAASFVTGIDILVDGGCLATPMPIQVAG